MAQFFLKDIVYHIIIRKIHDQWDLHISQKARTNKNLFSYPVSAEVLNEISGDTITFQRESDQNQFQEKKMYTS